MLKSVPARRWFVAVMGVCVLASACGTGVHDQIVALHSRNAGAPNAGASSASSGGASGKDTVGASTFTVPGGSTGQIAGAGNTSTTEAASGSGSGSQASADTSHAPVSIGEVGNWSGVAGSAFAPSRDALGAWAASVNAGGGILGHPVKILVADDGGDPATDMSQIRDLVENHHVIALANLWPPFVNVAAIAKYAWNKGIPVVGVPDGDPGWFQNPAAFPMEAGGDALIFGYAKAMADGGAKKVGAAYCVESPNCKVAVQKWAKFASQLGLQVVYEGQISLTQPDYTAQCLQAQGDGAQSLLFIADAPTVGRFADSCARQNYRPVIVQPGAQASDAQRASFEGSESVIGAFPWLLTSGSPALSEYGQAMAKYNRSPVGALSGEGWVTGKGLQRALEISLTRSPVPSSQGLFQALWTFRGETLGGLTPPLSYFDGRPATPVACSFLVKVSGGKWIAPDGAAATICKP
ncbi:MAG: ABC transporter substrate-binding protein [Acidimicrobiales bacterium]